MITGKIFSVKRLEILDHDDDNRLKELEKDIAFQGQKLRWNTVALESLREQVSAVTELFSNSLEEMDSNITAVSRTANSLANLTKKEIPDDYHDVIVQVRIVADGIADINSSISPLKEAGVNGDVWQNRKNQVSDLSLKIQNLNVSDRRVKFVDIGTVTKDDIGNALQEKVTGSFGAVKGILDGNEISGWWIKQGNSGNGLLFDQNSNRILSLFKSNDGVCDIRIIWGPDMGNVSDLTTVEKNFIAALLESGLSVETWTTAVADVAEIQEKKIWLDQTVTAGLGTKAWTNLISVIENVSKVQTLISSAQTLGLSVDSWDTVKDLLLKEDSYTLIPAQKSFLTGLEESGLASYSWTNVLTNILLLAEVRKIENVGITVTSWEDMLAAIANLKDVVQLISSVTAADFDLETWSLAEKAVVN